MLSYLNIHFHGHTLIICVSGYLTEVQQVSLIINKNATLEKFWQRALAIWWRHDFRCWCFRHNLWSGWSGCYCCHGYVMSEVGWAGPLCAEECGWPHPFGEDEEEGEWVRKRGIVKEESNHQAEVLTGQKYSVRKKQKFGPLKSFQPHFMAFIREQSLYRLRLKLVSGPLVKKRKMW